MCIVRLIVKLFLFSDNFDVDVFTTVHALERMDQRNITIGEIQLMMRKSFHILDKEEGSEFDVMIRSKSDDISLIFFPVRFEGEKFRLILKTVINDGEAYVTNFRENVTHVYDI